MLILILVIFIILIIASAILKENVKFLSGKYNALEVIEFTSMIICAIVAIALIIVAILNFSCYKIDDKINMYTEENTKIEKQISDTVKEYMKHENETYSNLKPESSIAIATAYSELKSNELVSRQIDTYNTNNDKIKELKENQINIGLYHWLLYFGK